MNFFEVIKNRHSVRKFLSEEIPGKDIYKILDAARLAPSSHNAQMWHFLVISNKDILEQLKSAISNKYDEFKQLPAALKKQKQLDFSKKYSTFFVEAPITIAVLMKPYINITEQILTKENMDDKEIKRLRPRPDLQSIGAAIENICLAATALGYGSCWMTAPIVAYEEMEKILDIKPEYQLVALVPIGKPDPRNKEIETKKEIHEIITFIE